MDQRRFLWQSDSGPVVAMQLGSDAEVEKSDESDQEQDEVTPSLRHILEGLCRCPVMLIQIRDSAHVWESAEKFRSPYFFNNNWSTMWHHFCISFHVHNLR